MCVCVCVPVYNCVQVRALLSGMVLVVDEADKAPTHVTCILKNIIEGSEITLADGRKIVHQMKSKTLNKMVLIRTLSVNLWDRILL